MKILNTYFWKHPICRLQKKRTQMLQKYLENTELLQNTEVYNIHFKLHPSKINPWYLKKHVFPLHSVKNIHYFILSISIY